MIIYELDVSKINIKLLNLNHCILCNKPDKLINYGSLFFPYIYMCKSCNIFANSLTKFIRPTIIMIINLDITVRILFCLNEPNLIETVRHCLLNCSLHAITHIFLLTTFLMGKNNIIPTSYIPVQRALIKKVDL